MLNLTVLPLSKNKYGGYFMFQLLFLRTGVKNFVNNGEISNLQISASGNTQPGDKTYNTLIIQRLLYLEDGLLIT